MTGGPEGSLRLTPERPGFKEKMEIAERGTQKYRNALRELGKVKDGGETLECLCSLSLNPIPLRPPYREFG